MNRKSHPKAQSAPGSLTDEAWKRAADRPRVLFDALCHEWTETSLAEKIHVLRSLETAGLLAPLLAEYVDRYGRYNRHVLDGLREAVLAYKDVGYSLVIPRAVGKLPPVPERPK